MNRNVVVAIALLVAIAGSLFYARVKYLAPSFLPSGSKGVWEVEAEVAWTPEKSGERLSFEIPQPRLGVTLTDESFDGEEVSKAIVGDKYRRIVRWERKLDDGEEKRVFYNAVLTSGMKKIIVPKRFIEEAPPASKVFKQKELQQLVVLQRAIGKKVEPKKLIICARFGRCGEADPFGRFRLNQIRLARAVAAALRYFGYPTLVATGFDSRYSGKTGAMQYWLRVKQGDQWHSYGLVEEFSGADMIFWRFDNGEQLIQPDDTTKVSFSVQAAATDGFRTTVHERMRQSLLWRVMSLQNVPVALQANYQVLLMVPICALIITMLRVFVGVPMFGTFMPLLLALAFRDMGLKWGLLLLLGIVMLGLFARRALKSLRLLFVPRVSATLSLAVLLVIVTSRLSYELSFFPGLSVTLFPIVIITMTIERMSISLEEVGLKKTGILLSNSLLSATLCHLVISNRYVQHWIFTFPETLLVVLAVIFACGRYSGYRLLELWRFRHFAKEEA